MMLVISRTNEAAERLLTFEDQRRRLVDAERREGWLVDCVEAGVYLTYCRELIDALVERLSAAPGPCVEVCGGDGRLASALRGRGLPIVVTDVAPPAGREADVQALSAQEAITLLRPRTVLTCFSPLDAGVDAAVAASESVTDYFVMQSTLNGRSFDFLIDRGWRLEYVGAIARWMITRDDLWLPSCGGKILQQGQAWRLRRG